MHKNNKNEICFAGQIAWPSKLAHCSPFYATELFINIFFIYRKAFEQHVEFGGLSESNK